MPSWWVSKEANDYQRKSAALLTGRLGLNINLDVFDPSMSDNAFKWPGSGKYFTGLEVFHSLHCLVSDAERG
jgi:hypothetical protein